MGIQSDLLLYKQDGIDRWAYCPYSLGIFLFHLIVWWYCYRDKRNFITQSFFICLLPKAPPPFPWRCIFAVPLELPRRGELIGSREQFYTRRRDVLDVGTFLMPLWRLFNWDFPARAFNIEGKLELQGMVYPHNLFWPERDWLWAWEKKLPSLSFPQTREVWGFFTKIKSKLAAASDWKFGEVSDRCVIPLSMGSSLPRSTAFLPS